MGPNKVLGPQKWELENDLQASPSGRACMALSFKGESEGGLPPLLCVGVAADETQIWFYRATHMRWDKAASLGRPVRLGGWIHAGLAMERSGCLETPTAFKCGVEMHGGGFFHCHHPLGMGRMGVPGAPACLWCVNSVPFSSLPHLSAPCSPTTEVR